MYIDDNGVIAWEDRQGRTMGRDDQPIDINKIHQCEQFCKGLMGNLRSKANAFNTLGNPILADELHNTAEDVMIAVEAMRAAAGSMVTEGYTASQEHSGNLLALALHQGITAVDDTTLIAQLYIALQTAQAHMAGDRHTEDLHKDYPVVQEALAAVEKKHPDLKHLPKFGIDETSGLHSDSAPVLADTTGMIGDGGFNDNGDPTDLDPNIDWKLQ